MFTYDAVGRLASKTNNGGSLEYAYDRAGNLVESKTTPSGGTALTTLYRYNAANEMDQITEPKVLDWMGVW